MRKIFFIVLLLSLSACELIIIGTRAPSITEEIIEYNQNSALGAIYLFKAELDSNNVPAASHLLKKQDGDNYLAIERYEKFYEIHRIKRMISTKEVTDVKSENYGVNSVKYNLEFDFRRRLFFTALKIDNNWFITDMGSHE